MQAKQPSYSADAVVRETEIESSLKFHEHEVLHELKHYLPAQAPLKDFIHHNTLHAFQHLKFGEAINRASVLFGYKTSLTLQEYRNLYASGRISKPVLERTIIARKGDTSIPEWIDNALTRDFDEEKTPLPRIGALRAHWKKEYHMDMDSMVHPILFRVLCSFLDQGIAVWAFPVLRKNFLTSLREIESTSASSIFRGKRARDLFLGGHCGIRELLDILVGDETLYKHYLFDQQFAHQGWSGMVSAVEDQPQTLLDRRDITLRDLIVLELLLEIDALDDALRKPWSPIAATLKHRPVDLLAPSPSTELQEAILILQEAFEWTYYEDVLAGVSATAKHSKPHSPGTTFQAMFCIDDRECSLRRYLEKTDNHCETFGTPGFFGAEFFFQPGDGKFYTKLCPAPVTPKYLIKETGSRKKQDKDVHFSKHTHSFYSGWLISQTLGFWSALKLFINIFRPSMGPATASSLKHMDKYASLTIEHTHPDQHENGLQIGFTVEEMAQRVEGLLRSIGLVKDFAPLVYVVGHGASSVNNPHYAAYDCGACSGRAGSVNSRVICFMANHANVRKILARNGIVIPDETQFVGGLHDTTRDEVIFFDEQYLSAENRVRHSANEKVFGEALDLNSKERSRRFELVNTGLSAPAIHTKMTTRSVSLFEPRPELNHATNTLCVVGRRDLTKGLFLDRRAFLNSYDHAIDPEGTILFNVMKPLGQVCGGINLEYFFSRVDNQKLGAGTKLPHNVMGLFGVANGIDGDLRPGLPSQMIEVHDPIRLMVIVEHFPDVVLKTIRRSAEVYEWFINEWVYLIAVDPETGLLYAFNDGAFTHYRPLKDAVERVKDLRPILESNHENLPVYLIETETV